MYRHTRVAMLDLELLRSFVSVVDAGGFTRAGERVHRTQSTVSQQIKRLEESFGRALLQRSGKRVSLTDEGERLLSYARRLLALAAEACDVVAKPASDGVVRLGIPEDFAAHRLAQMLSRHRRARPSLRLDVRCDIGTELRVALERGEIDVALVKRTPGDGRCVAAWPERLQWVTSCRHPIEPNGDPVPLAVFQHGCLYRNRAIHALEAAGRSWRIAYSSPNMAGIQAAVSAGLGVSILPDVAILPGHRILGRKDGFRPVDNTEVALIAADDANPAARRLADLLVEFCNAVPIRGAKISGQSPRQRAAGMA
jgi:DNA-binding transcriptional LysR family regulator